MLTKQRKKTYNNKRAKESKKGGDLSVNALDANFGIASKAKPKPNRTLKNSPGTAVQGDSTVAEGDLTAVQGDLQYHLNTLYRHIESLNKRLIELEIKADPDELENMVEALKFVLFNDKDLKRKYEERMKQIQEAEVALEKAGGAKKKVTSKRSELKSKKTKK